MGGVIVIGVMVEIAVGMRVYFRESGAKERGMIWFRALRGKHKSVLLRCGWDKQVRSLWEHDVAVTCRVLLVVAEAVAPNTAVTLSQAPLLSPSAPLCGHIARHTRRNKTSWQSSEIVRAHIHSRYSEEQMGSLCLVIVVFFVNMPLHEV